MRRYPNLSSMFFKLVAEVMNRYFGKLFNGSLDMGVEAVSAVRSLSFLEKFYQHFFCFNYTSNY